MAEAHTCSDPTHAHLRRPAANVRVILWSGFPKDGSFEWSRLNEQRTNDDGRVANMLPVSPALLSTPLAASMVAHMVLSTGRGRAGCWFGRPLTAQALATPPLIRPPHTLTKGHFKLTFATGEYHTATGRECFFPQVEVCAICSQPCCPALQPPPMTQHVPTNLGIRRLRSRLRTLRRSIMCRFCSRRSRTRPIAGAEGVGG